jgi:hypothetical protein
MGTSGEGFCEDANGPSCSITGGEYSEKLSDRQLLMKVSCGYRIRRIIFNGNDV